MANRNALNDWERLESDTANLNSDAPNSSFEPADLNSVTLPAPPEGASWRLVPDAYHVRLMHMGATKYEWDRYPELNADPEPEPEPPAIEAGMWVRCVGDRDACYVARLTSEGIVIWWHQYSGPGADMWECDHHQDDDETYEPCDPPDNAQELYDLLGIEDDPPAL